MHGGGESQIGWVEVEAALHRNLAVKGREKMVRKPGVRMCVLSGD